MTWSFEQINPRFKSRNPVSDEFFADASVASDVSALVRESIQNSLDAKTGSQAKVVFTIGSSLVETHSSWFSDLPSHVGAALGSEVANEFEKECRFLLVEDFGTSGLRGNPTWEYQRAKTEPAAEASYYYFVHSEGESGKNQGSRGTWGVGKIVFQKLSKVKSFFILSDRGEGQSPKTVVLGQSVLKLHNLADASYIPDGWFAKQMHNGLHIPVEDETAEEFRTDWGLKRLPGDLGLSVLVPFVPETVTLPLLASTVAAEYFIPILTGELVCEIHDGDVVEVLDSSNLIKVIQASLDANPSNELQALMSLAQMTEAKVFGKTSKFEGKYAVGSTRATDLFLNETVVEKMQSSFSNGEICEIDIDISIPTLTGATAQGKLSLLMKKTGARHRLMFSREGILVRQKKGIFLNRFSGLVLVSEGPLADLLAKAEGPAHENWSEGARKFMEAYGSSQAARNVLAIVRGVAGQIERLLTETSGFLDENIFANIFSMPAASKKTPGDGDGGDGNSNPTVVTPPPPPVANPSPLEILPRPMGFLVKASPSAAHGKFLQKKFVVAVAYKLSRGNSFSKWVPSDFLMTTMAIKPDGISEVRSFENKIEFQVDNPSFSLKVTGFDTSIRDIEIEIVEVSK